MDPIAWDFIHQYAAGTMPLPNIESSLHAHLGNHYIDSDWQPMLKAVMESEDNNTALDTVSTLCTAASSYSGIKIHIPTLSTATEPTPKPQQLILVESEVMETVHHLKEQNRIFGKLTVEELIEPPEEWELPEPVLDGSVKAIADAVRWETAAANGEVIDIDDSDGDGNDEDDSAALPCSELIKLCKELEAGCMHYAGDPQFSLNFLLNLELIYNERSSLLPSRLHLIHFSLVNCTVFTVCCSAGTGHHTCNSMSHKCHINMTNVLCILYLMHKLSAVLLRCVMR